MAEKNPYKEYEELKHEVKKTKKQILEDEIEDDLDLESESKRRNKKRREGATLSELESLMERVKNLESDLTKRLEAVQLPASNSILPIVMDMTTSTPEIMEIFKQKIPDKMIQSFTMADLQIFISSKTKFEESKFTHGQDTTFKFIENDFKFTTDLLEQHLRSLVKIRPLEAGENHFRNDITDYVILDDLSNKTAKELLYQGFGGHSHSRYYLLKSGHLTKSEHMSFGTYISHLVEYINQMLNYLSVALFEFINTMSMPNNEINKPTLETIREYLIRKINK